MENKRSLMTKRIIRESLIEMLQTQTIDKISVLSLCEKAEINRSTFYAHYDDIRQVLSEYGKEIQNSIMPFIFPLNNQYEDDFNKFYTFVKAHQKDFTALVSYTSFVNDFTNAARENARKLYYSVFDNIDNDLSIQIDIEVTFDVFGFFSAVNRWLEKGCYFDPSYITRSLTDKILKSYYDLKKNQNVPNEKQTINH